MDAYEAITVVEVLYPFKDEIIETAREYMRCGDRHGFEVWLNCRYVEIVSAQGRNIQRMPFAKEMAYLYMKKALPGADDAPVQGFTSRWTITSPGNVTNDDPEVYQLLREEDAEFTKFRLYDSHGVLFAGDMYDVGTGSYDETEPLKYFGAERGCVRMRVLDKEWNIREYNL